MCSPTKPQSPEVVERFGQAMLASHPIGFRSMARASAEDLRGALASVAVPG